MLDFSQDFFTLFGLPRSYKVDRDRLTEAYRTFQQQFHPDRFATATDQERRYSLQVSTHINEAHETLKDPILRGRYLLSLYDLELSRQSSNIDDPQFLMQQMEHREALSQAKKESDPHRVIARVMRDIDQQMQQLSEKLVHCFEKPDAEVLNQAQELLHKMQFFKRLHEEAEQLETDLDEAI